MLYLVECQEKGNISNEYIAPYPGGTEASNAKEALNIVMNSFHGIKKKGEVTINGTTYFNFHAKPKKWENYKTPMSSEDRIHAFEDEMMDALEKKGFDPEFCLHGIRVKTGVDTWIIQIHDACDKDAQITLHHKNNWNANKDNTGCIPGFHKQTSGRFTVKSMINFMTSHENKWKAKGRRTLTHYAENSRY